MYAMYAKMSYAVPLMSHIEYVPYALLRLEERWDRQTYVTLTSRWGECNNCNKLLSVKHILAECYVL